LPHRIAPEAAQPAKDLASFGGLLALPARDVFRASGVDAYTEP
jgi:hypothetical protein